MRTPWYRRIKDLRDAATAGLDRLLSPELPDPEKILEAEGRRLKELEAEQRIKSLKRLAPFAGHAVMVTDGGPSDNDELMTRLLKDLDTAGFTHGYDVFGVSAHLDVRRSEKGSDLQIDMMNAIGVALRSRGNTVVHDRTVGVHKTSSEWLGDIAGSAEYICRKTNRTPEQVGQIAVVWAMDMLDCTGELPYYGEAFLLRGITPDATPPILTKQISVDPYRHRVEGR